MTEEQRRLETVLINRIEKILDEPEPDTKELQMVPALAHELNALWDITQYD